MKQKLVAELTLCGFLFFAVIMLAAGQYLYAYEKAQTAELDLTQQLVAHQQEQLTKSQLEISALLSANQTVAQQLEAEAAKRLLAEQESRAAQGKLTQLEETIQKNQTPNTSAVISQWRPRIAFVRCEWPPQDGKRVVKSGTAVLMPTIGSVSAQLLTSEHVITYLDNLPAACVLTFPDQNETIKIGANNIEISASKYDWAKLTVDDPIAYAQLLAQTPADRCKTTPAVGDSVVILGYPSIGTRDDITATEGIISGIEDSYYITSAKVERGNSGGAAILTKQNCYLGIPTFVDAGQIESLARILDQRVITE
jgi:hypothetical protein